jgi:YgiT-type zinc finger domain-containing protein
MGVLKMAKEYSDCFYCGGTVEEQLMPREFRWRGQLFIFENVPMGVCKQCGEKVLKPEVTKAIDRIVREQKKPTKTIQVPVYSYESDVA